MSNELRRGGIVLIAVASMFLLWSAVQSVAVYQQRVEQVNLRDVCRGLSDIQRDVSRLERLTADRDTKRALVDLARHLLDLERTIDRGVILR